jgi:hypothetical protein
MYRGSQNRRLADATPACFGTKAERSATVKAADRPPTARRWIAGSQPDLNRRNQKRKCDGPRDPVRPSMMGACHPSKVASSIDAAVPDPLTTRGQLTFAAPGAAEGTTRARLQLDHGVCAGIGAGNRLALRRVEFGACMDSLHDQAADAAAGGGRAGTR